jgi:hypothetical protein|eukprot:SAG25_NODE_1174_length_3698_cov_1.474854_2_plen_86_part_00
MSTAGCVAVRGGAFIVGEEFASRLSAYVKRYLRRGIPSLFADLKALYADAEKVGPCKHGTGALNVSDSRNYLARWSLSRVSLKSF